MNSRICRVTLRGLAFCLFVFTGALVCDAVIAAAGGLGEEPHGGGARPLPITLCGAARALSVEREPITPELRAKLEQEQEHWLPGLRAPLEEMRFCYRVHGTDWDGGFVDCRSFVSTHAYGQGYASGNTLVLTNSGTEQTPMVLALISDRASAQEIELQADPQLLGADGSRERRRLLWHLRESWQSGQNGISLEFGAPSGNSSLHWFYNAEEDKTLFYNRSAREGEKTLAEQKSPFHEIGMGSMGMQGSSLPKPKDAAAPTPGAEELPTTHCGADDPLRVECLRPEDMAAAVDDEGKPRFRYMVYSAALPGKRLCVTSRYRYGQAYACGGLLLLSTSGAHVEYSDDVMSFIVLDLRQGRAMEDELRLEAWEMVDVCSRNTLVSWDGVDEDGNWIGGSYSCRHWHRGEAISGNGERISVRLGDHIPNNCHIEWTYDAATGKTRLHNRRLRAVFDAELPHLCKELPVEVCDATTARPAAEGTQTGAGE